MNLQTQRRKHFFKVFFIAIMVATTNFNSNAQEIKFAGSQPPDSAVLKLFETYFAETFVDWKTVPERDAKRRNMVAAGYFYQDMDGTPIDFEGLTARQTKNNLKLEKVAKFDVILHQYESTAIITYKNFVRGQDRGETFENYGSAATVFIRENGIWKVLADINGREPNVRNPPAGLPPQKRQ